MLKTRIIPTLLYKNFCLVKGVGFDSWRRIGTPMQALKVYNMRRVDELIFLDITATGERRLIDKELVDDLADECFMPFTVGGGIRTVEDVRVLLSVGADRVSVGSAAVKDPGLIRQIADRFGSQCVVVSIDWKENANKPEVFIRSGTEPTGLDPVEWAKKAEEMGAGEILLTSIERDGTMEGYGIEVTRAVCEAVSIPVIASGGAGSYADMLSVLKDGKASAVAASSIFQFTEQTPREAKEYLHRHDIPVRML